MANGRRLTLVRRIGRLQSAMFSGRPGWPWGWMGDRQDFLEEYKILNELSDVARFFPSWRKLNDHAIRAVRYQLYG